MSEEVENANKVHMETMVVTLNGAPYYMVRLALPGQEPLVGFCTLDVARRIIAQAQETLTVYDGKVAN